VRYGKQLKDAM